MNAKLQHFSTEPLIKVARHAADTGRTKALVKRIHHPFPYAAGEVYLVALPDLREVELEDVAPTAPAVKIKGEGWMEGVVFHEAVKARLGRAVYGGGLLGHLRKVVREDGWLEAAVPPPSTKKAS